MIKAYFFDLDSTLLQMNQDEFLALFFKAVAKKSSSFGYHPEQFMNVFNEACHAMYHNDGKVLNADAFWSVMCKNYEEKKMRDFFDDFYEQEFRTLECVVKRTDTPEKIIEKLKKKGMRIILATNPLFPTVAQHIRISWTGINPADFELITDYDNSSFCKPTPEYYQEIMKKTGLKPEEVVMVGNDIDDDFNGILNGMGKVLITDYLINQHHRDIKKEDINSMTLDEFYHSL